MALYDHPPLPTSPFFWSSLKEVSECIPEGRDSQPPASLFVAAASDYLLSLSFYSPTLFVIFAPSAVRFRSNL